MEFAGIGVVPLEPPSEDLRPFFRRKYKSLVKIFSSCQNGIISRQELVNKSKSLAEQFPEEERKEVFREQMFVWDHIVMCDIKRESITVEEFIEVWLRRVFSDEQTRKALIERQTECASIFFKYIDTNKDGVIDFDEYSKKNAIAKDEVKKAIFDSFDYNKDGVIQLEEFQYATMMHHFVSGPESRFSYLYGPIDDED